MDNKESKRQGEEPSSQTVMFTSHKSPSNS